jgi:potassium/chloride transporter 9
MFYLDYRHGVIGVAVLIMLCLYLFARGPTTEWGDVSQALMFHQVRK